MSFVLINTQDCAIGHISGKTSRSACTEITLSNPGGLLAPSGRDLRPQSSLLGSTWGAYSHQVPLEHVLLCKALFPF